MGLGFVCAVRVGGRRRSAACAALRAVSAVRAGGVSADGSGPSVRRAAADGLYQAAICRGAAMPLASSSAHKLLHVASYRHVLYACGSRLAVTHL